MRAIVFIFVLIFSVTFNVTPAWVAPSLTREPAVFTSMGWDLTPAGMLINGYDLDRDSLPDYFTLRIVTKSYLSEESVFAVVANSPDHLVYFVDYDTARYFYIAAKHPLFYAIDANEDGHWDAMFRDVSEDGVNGNEEFYDSPSGKFWEIPIPKLQDDPFCLEWGVQQI
jgi:hypothetical protein